MLKSSLDFERLEEPSGELACWHEVRVGGKCPDRRAYHSSFLHNKR